MGLFSTFACTSKEIDPRCEIVAPTDEYRGQIAQHINGSELWQAFPEYLSPVREGARPMVPIELSFEREVTRKVLEEKMEDQWSGDLMGEAKIALTAIRGR
jgi:hypothetical protein